MPCPLLITHAQGNRTLVVACDLLAAKHGIQPGQTLAQARAHYADVRIQPWKPGEDARGLEALARYLMRFTPVVALATCDAIDLFTVEEPPDPFRLDHHLYLDLTGCEHLFGGLQPMLQAITTALQRLNIKANMAVAPTPGAAYALGLECDATRGAGLWPASSSTLPLLSLRLDSQTLHLLTSLGITTVAQLLKLPRKQLASRFGQSLLKRIDQFTGHLPEPLVPLPCYRPIAGQMNFEWPIDQPETIQQAFVQVLSPLLEECHRRAMGLRELRVTLPRIDAAPLTLTLRLSRPSRNLRLLLSLFQCAWEQQQHSQQRAHPLGGGAGRGGLQGKEPVFRRRRYERQSLDFPFTALSLKATQLASLPESQLAMGQPSCDAAAAWQETLDRLRLQFGEASVQQARLAESHMPERAFELITPGNEEGVYDSLQEAALKPGATGGVTPYAGAHRPLFLLPCPREIEVTVSPSDDRDGRPIQFRDDTFHRVTQWVGPERLGGAWWDGRPKTRDYFDVEDEAGRRYWIFRVQESNRWFLHGTFA